MYYADMFPAKTGSNGEWLSLRNHLEDTAGVMRILCEKWVPESVVKAAQLTPEEFAGVAKFCAASHDIGKASMAFLVNRLNVKDRLPEVAAGLESAGVVFHKCPDADKTPHNFASAAICKKHFGVPESVCEVLCTHHGRPRDNSDNFIRQINGLTKRNYHGDEPESKAVFEATWQEIYDHACQISGYGEQNLLPKLSIQAQMLLTGLLIIADWIASNSEYFPLIGNEPYPQDRLEQGWKKVNLPSYWGTGDQHLDEDSFRERFGFLPRDAQTEIIRTVEQAKAPGLFLVECQMGAGKTEAALAAAEILVAGKDAGGIFFGLPTKGTANGLFPRVIDWAKKVTREGDVTSLRLVHGDAAFNDLFESMRYQISDEDAAGNVTVNEWLLGSKRQLLSDFVVGTVDHALMAALRTKFIMLRHIGLAGKVVIIDEVHSYDAYMSEYLEYMLRWMGAYGVPVILLSATLTTGKKEELVNAYLNRHEDDHVRIPQPELYPCLTWTDGGDVFTEELSPVPDQAMEVAVKVVKTEQIAEIIKDRLQGTGCTGIIMNTVKAARETADHLRCALPGYEVMLIHSRFLPEDRKRLEDEVVRLCGKKSGSAERRGVIIVGTQVLEQSLDVDFDLLFTEWCPMDLLLQRIGRAHRHRVHDTLRPAGAAFPICFICEDDYFPLYDEYLLARTREELAGHGIIKLPDEIRSLVGRVYDLELGTGNPLQEKHRRSIEESRSKADIWRMPDPKYMDSMKGMLKLSASADDEAEEAQAVRDIDDGVQALLLKIKDGRVMTAAADAEMDADAEPDWQHAKVYLQQRVTLPRALSGINSLKLIRKKAEEQIPVIMAHKWFANESVVLLDANDQAVLSTDNGMYTITYSRSEGLDWRKGC